MPPSVEAPAPGLDEAAIRALFDAYRGAMASVGLPTDSLTWSDFTRVAQRAWEKAAEQLPGKRFRIVPVVRDGQVGLRAEVL